MSESRLADARRELDVLWKRCELWELSPAVCDLAALLAPDQALRTPDAGCAVSGDNRSGVAADRGLELLTADRRLADAAGSA